MVRAHRTLFSMCKTSDMPEEGGIVAAVKRKQRDENSAQAEITEIRGLTTEEETLFNRYLKEFQQERKVTRRYMDLLHRLRRK